MKEEGRTMDPRQVYQQGQDQQRIVIVGKQARTIAAMTFYVLNDHQRMFDFVIQYPAGSGPATRFSDAPIIIIEENETADAGLLEYRHHIGLVSPVDPSQQDSFRKFADATPKGGILIYADSGPAASIGKQERADITALGYRPYPHRLDNGRIQLLTTKDEKVPVLFKGDENLESVSAAKELLKKIGITSSQFYRSIARFEN